MAATPGAPRIAMYSHDTYGLGHLTRTSRLARGITRAFPGSTILILSGSPIAHRFTFPPGVDYIKLPAVVKTGPDTYVPRELGISRQSVRRMRTQIIYDALEEFRPHLFLVDNVPAGMKGELLPILAWLHGRRPETRIHLNLRDVLDDCGVIRAAWRRDDIYALLRTCYDAIHIFGLPGVFDAVGAYCLPADLSEHLGYVGPDVDGAIGGAHLPPAAPGRQRVLVTIGGGGDGASLLETVAGLQVRLARCSPFQFHVVTGPLMDPGTRDAVGRQLADLDGVTLHEFVEDLPAWMAGCDLVLSMGGYNTLCEILACARRSVVVPRVYPRQEQLIRARAFERHGLVEVIDPRELSAESLEARLRRSLRRTPVLPAPPRIFGGVAALQQRLRALLGWGSGKTSARGSASRRPAAIPRSLNHKGALLILATLTGALAAGAAPDEIRPARVFAEVAAGYDTNILNSSDAELNAFDTQDPEAFFAINRTADASMRLAVEADWRLGRVLGMKPKLRAGYARDQFAHNPITGVSAYTAEMSTRLPAEMRSTLTCAYRPQVYGRHRVDKDALPGDARYRAEAHRRWDVEWTVERAVNPTVSVGASVEGTWKNYTEPFVERDQRRLGLALSSEVTTARRVSLEISGGWRRALSRNQPDLGKDLSYYEWEIGPEITWDGPSADTELSAALDLSWRHYTSRDPDDENHYRRHDLFGGVSAALLYRLSGCLAWRLAGGHAWRSAALNSGEEADYDEEGSFSEWVWESGLRWEWER